MCFRDRSEILAPRGSEAATSPKQRSVSMFFSPRGSTWRQWFCRPNNSFEGDMYWVSTRRYEALDKLLNGTCQRV